MKGGKLKVPSRPARRSRKKSKLQSRTSRLKSNERHTFHVSNSFLFTSSTFSCFIKIDERIKRKIKLNKISTRELLLLSLLLYVEHRRNIVKKKLFSVRERNEITTFATTLRVTNKTERIFTENIIREKMFGHFGYIRREVGEIRVSAEWLLSMCCVKLSTCAQHTAAKWGSERVSCT